MPAPPPDHAPTRVERVKAAAVAARVKADEAQQRLQDLRPQRASVDIAFCTLERDRVRGARLLAGALAYQFFFWLLPFALVLVGGIGLLGSVSSSAPDDLANNAGVAGYLARSIHDAGADRGHAHLWALAIGLPALYFAGVAFVRALATAHALIWEIPAPKLTHKPMAALAMLGVVLAFVLSLGAAGAVRHHSSGIGLGATLLTMLVTAALWLFVSWHMPRAVDRWQELVPGAVVVAVCMLIVHLVVVYYISHKVATASSNYGAIGAATGILLALFILSRVLVIGASVNAEVWARKQQTAVRAAGLQTTGVDQATVDQATAEGRTTP